MTDLNALYTKQAPTQAKQAGTNNQLVAPLSSNNPLFTGNGSFFDLFFTLQASNGRAQLLPPGTEKPLVTEKTALTFPPVAVEETNAGGKIDDALLSEIAPTSDQDDSAIPDIFAGLLVQAPQSDISGNPSILNARAADLGEQIDIQNRLIENGIPTLIATDLTPQQLKALNSLSDEQLQNLTSLDLAALANGTLGQNLEVPAPLGKAIADLKNTIKKSPDTELGKQLTKISPELAVQLNALEPGGDKSTKEDFTNILRDFAETQADTADIDPTILRAIAKDAPANFGDYLKNMNATRMEAGANLLGVSMPEGFSALGQNGLDTGLDNNFTLGNTLQNTQAAQIQSMAKANIAGGAHPVTGVIAATLTKAANGAPKDITVQLHPEELGRVNVKVTLNKNKSVNAILTIEKPETYLMLQKDQAALQQTLQNLGITAGGELSFQLAHDGAFDRNPDQNNSENKTGAREIGATEEAIEIDTGMRWFVDPTTGRTRYNILA